MVTAYLVCCVTHEIVTPVELVRLVSKNSPDNCEQKLCAPTRRNLKWLKVWHVVVYCNCMLHITCECRFQCQHAQTFWRGESMI
jgi:hypothetical protein